MAISAEAQARIQYLRQRALSGEITDQESKEAITLMREDRVRAAEVSKTARSSKSKASINSDDLLSELE